MTNNFRILPAIDIRGGQCVRLRQGDYAQETVYGKDPAEMAKRWYNDGAKCLHLVDLDGAKTGRAVNRDAVAAIVRAVPIPCELGGGIRDEAAIRDYLELGIVNLIIGTPALKQPDWFAAMAEQFPDKLILGIDAKNGMVATDGWLDVSEVAAIELAKRFESLPLAGIVYTDIATDGMMQGPNVPEMIAMSRNIRLPVIASGGVTTAADVKKLYDGGLSGCIIGKALYEGTIVLKELAS
ncbi:MAG: 1-(5-phosphoribosyl)-5-[(5-phosphoribosylamino)methylideneamino]imidazole-4-carboxamide isomerase [Planctomycetaceae bacterium]|nr:1-(5-phosphoribosyl)-5-[(5-phosphoribosylamino)methylideneamino]imidazole-4-carboxamide isomerase [Planctomycetaceae bacterium]